MSRNVGLLILGLAMLVAASCAALITWRLMRAPGAAAPDAQISTPAFDVKPAPPMRVRLEGRVSVNIDLPGDPILVAQRAIGAPRDLAVGIPVRPGAPPPSTVAQAFFVSSPLALTEAGAMLKFTGGGQDALALRDELAENMAALNGVASEASMATDDDGGVATPDNAATEALTNANSNRLDLAPADAPSVRSAVIKAIVETRIDELLTRDGFTMQSATDAAAYFKAQFRVDSLAAGGSMLAVGTRDPAGGYRVAQLSIFQGREYVGAVALSENGAYAEAARPNAPENFLQDDEAAAPPTRFTLADGLFSAGLAGGAPEAVVREAIQMLGSHLDLATGLTADATFRLLWSKDFRDRARSAGKVIYVEVRSFAGAYACYAIESAEGVFRCFDPRASAPVEAAPLPPVRPGADAPMPPSHAHLADSGAAGVGGILTPIKGAPVTSRFGLRFHPILHYWRLHGGVDFGAPVGSPVRAVADGTVEIASVVSGFGLHLKVKSNGFATSSSHLSEIIEGVKVGTEVKQGQIVAYSGNTGLSTGPHLHFQYYIDNEAVDPLPHFGQEVQASAPSEGDAPRPSVASAGRIPLPPTPEPRAAPSAETLAFPGYKALVDKVLAALN